MYSVFIIPKPRRVIKFIFETNPVWRVTHMPIIRCLFGVTMLDFWSDHFYQIGYSLVKNRESVKLMNPWWHDNDDLLNRFTSGMTGGKALYRCARWRWWRIQVSAIFYISCSRCLSSNSIRWQWQVEYVRSLQPLPTGRSLSSEARNNNCDTIVTRDSCS